MLTHQYHEIEVNPNHFNIEDRGAFDAAIYLIEVEFGELEEGHDIDFPLSQIKPQELRIGFYVIAALEPDTFGGNEILEWKHFKSLKKANQAVSERVEKWHFNEGKNLPQHAENGKFKLVNVENGWESQEQYESKEDAEKVLAYRERQFFKIPGSQQAIFTERIADAGEFWGWSYRWQKFCWEK